jgi:hypothetical protein
MLNIREEYKKLDKKQSKGYNCKEICKECGTKQARNVTNNNWKKEIT